jgi:hypothetical protein
MRAPAFGAPKALLPKNIKEAAGNRSRRIDSFVWAFGTLSEESQSSILRMEIALDHRTTDHFFVTCPAVCHSDRSEESQTLAIDALAKPITRDVSRRST